MSNQISEATELRKLNVGCLEQLAALLEDVDVWKNVMAIIPKKLERNNYECRLSVDNPPKYTSEHFRIIQRVSENTKRLCFEILVDEWGCSGRVRPTVGHLLFLLNQAELYRAANYVTVELLHKEPVRRLDDNISLTPSQLDSVSELEQLLDSQNYPSKAIEEIIRLNQAQTDKRNVSPVIPKIVIEPPDMMPFPSVAALSSDNESLSYTSNDTSSEIAISSKSSLERRESSVNENLGDVVVESITRSPGGLPLLSELLNDVSQDKNSNDNNVEADSQSMNMPRFSELGVTNPSESNQFQNSDQLPECLNFIQIPSNSSSGENNHVTTVPSAPILRQCDSPLPNMELNTTLSHFPYADIEVATKHFDSTPHMHCDDLTESTGRFLGSGGFGSVYLALGLLDKPVAVKKITLCNTVIKPTDLVSRQFKNEVELLCRCKHENLVSILGYSCDGQTYCLLYEYVPGGNLKDRLQKHKEELAWTQRLHIALGTAKGLSYLHTEHPTALVHCDVKSANILLDCTNKPKLCDFGVVKDPSKATHSTNIIGTAPYIAPEAYREDVSVKMDTYSFGVVLLELLTGLPPIDNSRAETGSDLITHVQTCLESNDVTPLLDFKAGSWRLGDIDFGNKLYEITTKCLQDLSRERPTMTEVAEELSDLVLAVGSNGND